MIHSVLGRKAIFLIVTSLLILTFAATVTPQARALQVAPTATTLTIYCNVLSADKGNQVVIYGALTSYGSPVSTKTITITYYNGANWVSIGSTTTLPDGAYKSSWIIPASLPNGQYPVKADFAGDSNYQSSSAVTGSNNINGPMLYVTPEAPIGGIVALFACFAAVFVFLKTRKNTKKQ